MEAGQNRKHIIDPAPVGYEDAPHTTEPPPDRTPRRTGSGRFAIEARISPIASTSMSSIQPRYEFRTWAESIDDVRERIEALSACLAVRESTETYIVSSTTTLANPKVRTGQLDVKVLLTVREGFEQWEPRLKASFPIAAELLREELFPLLALPAPVLERERYSFESFMDFVERSDDMSAVEVTKKRRAFTIAECITEFAEVEIAGRRLQTAAIESVDMGALKEARCLTGLDAHDNINYPTVIKQTIGWFLP